MTFARPERVRAAYTHGTVQASAGIKPHGGRKTLTPYVVFLSEATRELFGEHPAGPVKMQLLVGAKKDLGKVRMRVAPEGETYDVFFRRGSNKGNYVIQTRMLPIPEGAQERAREPVTYRKVDGTIEITLPWAAELGLPAGKESDDPPPAL